MFSSEVLTLETDGHVATLWLDSPERRNALGTAFWADLPRAMETLASDREVRAVVLAARGRCFTVGLDLKDAFLASSASDASSSDGTLSPSAPPSPALQAMGRYREIRRLQAAITSVADCPVPTVAAIHGYCLGGGIDLVTACDIRLASADVLFSVRETRVAIVADLGTLQRLPRIVGPGHTAELVYSGRDFDAGHALSIGLVNHVHPDADSTVEAARELAGEIAANSPLVVSGARSVLRAGEGRSVAEGLDFVAAWNAGMLVSDDLFEAMGAFAAKRPPRFTGR